MPRIVFTVLLLISIKSQSQFFYSPFPPTKNEYALFEKSGVKIGYEYEIVSGNKTLISYIEFGNKGLPAASYENGINEHGDSAILTERIYKYNQWLKLSSYTLADFEENQKSVFGYTYDSKGRLIKKIAATMDPVISIYKYDATGRIVSEHSTVKMPELNKEGDPTGKSFDRPYSKSIFKYDAKNRLTEEWFYLAEIDATDEKKPFHKTKWEYNSKNQFSKISNFDQEGSLTMTQEFTFNEKNLLAKKITTTFPDKTTREFIYEYCTDCKQSWMQ